MNTSLKSKQIAIYGAGALGTILGAYLTKAGLNVDLINRNKSHVQGFKKNGAQVKGTVNFKIQVKALLPNEISKKYDIVFLMTKQLDNENIVSYIQNFMVEDGIICTTQNGIPELSVASIIGEEKTIGCAIAWGATMLGNGVCELTSTPDSLTFSIGSPGKNNQNKVNEVKNILEQMGPAIIEDNFMGARWSKLFINASFSGMSTVLGCTFGEAAQNKASRKCILHVIKECIDVADKANINIERVQGKDIRRLLNYNNNIKKAISYHMIPLLIKKHAKLKASMLQDIENKKPTEVDAINGIVSKYGHKYNIETPYNDMIIKIIHDIEKGTLSTGFKNLTFFNF
jgi:2-dehydropantoate 2-reductase